MKKLFTLKRIILFLIVFGFFGFRITGKAEAAPTLTLNSTVVTESAMQTTISGTVNPNSISTSVVFLYGATNPNIGGSNCNTSTFTNYTTAQTFTGSTNQSVTASLQGLIPGVTYYYCGIAFNTTGVAFTPVNSFTQAEDGTGNGCTSLILSSDYTVSSNCKFANPTYDGVDKGSGVDNDGVLTIAKGTSFTISSNQTVAYGILYKPGATITRLSGGSIQRGAIWSPDADGDGYPDAAGTANQTVSKVQPAGYIRRSTASTRSVDCNSNNSNIYVIQYVATDADQDGYSTAIATPQCAGAGSTISGRTYNKNSSNVYSLIDSASILGTNDCNDSNASYTTSCSPNSVTTAAASSVTSTTATFNGSAAPNNAATTGHFRYSTTNPGTCNDTFGTRVPASAGSDSNLGSAATGTQSYSQGATGLTPGLTYYYCAIGINSYGTGVGSPVSFTTLAAAPAVTTSAASSITSRQGVLNSTINPNGASTNVTYAYGTSNVACGSLPSTLAGPTGLTGSSPLSGASTQATLSSLIPNTTYYFCAYATNAIGTTYGSVTSFTTLTEAPSVTTSTASSITGTSVVLNSTVNPNNSTTSITYRYGTSNVACASLPSTLAGPTGLTGTSPLSGVTTRATLSSLIPNTTYYFCATANNIAGTTNGSVTSFATSAIKPSITGYTWVYISSSSEFLGSTVNPNNSTTSITYRYGTSNPACSSHASTLAGPTGLTGTSAITPNWANATGLTGNTTYYYCATANNTAGTTYGIGDTNTNATFLTIPGAPTGVSAGSATQTSLSISWTAPTGGAASYNILWCTGASCTPSTVITGVTSAYAHTSRACNTTYGYLVRSVNATGTTDSSTFYGATSTCAPPTVTTSAASSITGTGAVLNSTVNPNNELTNVTYAYGTSNVACGSLPSTLAGPTGLTGSSPLSGASTQATLSSLIPNTTYYFCAYATNLQGTTYGSVASFATSAVAPSVTTSAATSITSSQGVPNSTVNPNNSTTSITYRYGTSNVACASLPSTLTGPTGLTGTSNLSGATTQATLSSLLPNTTYYFCATANNIAGTTNGSVTSFTTTAIKPSVTAQSATSLAITTASLTSTVNPNNQTSSITYRYSTTNQVCSSHGTTATGPTGLTGTSAISPNTTGITGLTGNTTYYYCATANNATGTTNAVTDGNASSNFLTYPGAATGTSAVPASGTSMTITWTAPTGGAASYNVKYCYGASCVPGSTGTQFGTATGVTSPATITGLTGSGQTYYFIVTSVNATGSTDTASFSQVLGTAPSVTTSAATASTNTQEILNSTVNPNYLSTNITYRWGTSNVACSSLPNTLAGPTGLTGSSPLSGATTQATLTGLTGNTQYYFCATAVNTVNTTYGTTTGFITVPAAPGTPSVGYYRPGNYNTISWSASGGGGAATIYYHLYYCYDGSNTCTPAGGDLYNSTGTSQNHTPGGATYQRYRLYANNSAGNSSYSAIGSANIGSAYTCYRNNDADSYGASTYGTMTQYGGCSGGYLTSSNDCDDARSDINPGISTYSTTQISGGPKNGTWDYNCSGGNDQNASGNQNGGRMYYGRNCALNNCGPYSNSCCDATCSAYTGYTAGAAASCGQSYVTGYVTGISTLYGCSNCNCSGTLDASTYTSLGTIACR